MTSTPSSIRLGGSPIEVSRLVLGGMALSQARGLGHAERLVDQALELGVTTIDTAPLYDYGGSEQILGTLLKTRRQRLTVLTKVGLRWDTDHGDVLFSADEPGLGRVVVRRDSRPASIRHEVEASLTRLGTDRLDLVQVHHRDHHAPIADTMGELVRLRDEGKLRAIGVSNYSVAELEQAQAGTHQTLASLQAPYSLLSRAIEGRELTWTRSQQIGFLAYSPLAEGVLAGRMLDGRPLPDDYRRGGPLFDPRNLPRIHQVLRSTIEPIARDHDAGLGAVALAWLLAQPGVTCVIAGASSQHQLVANARALILSLSAEQLGAIDFAFAQLRVVQPDSISARVLRKVKRVIQALHKP